MPSVITETLGGYLLTCGDRPIYWTWGQGDVVCSLVFPTRKDAEQRIRESEEAALKQEAFVHKHGLRDVCRRDKLTEHEARVALHEVATITADMPS